MDVICGLVGKFCYLVIDQSWEQLLYLIYCHRNIDELNRQLVELDLERSSLQHRIDDAKNNGEQIIEKVLHWLGEVDELSKQLQKFHEESQAKVECNITSCPNPWLRYKLSKRAKAMTEEAAKIYTNRNFDRISYPVPLHPMVELFNREGNEGIDSRVQIMNQVLEELGNHGVYMIGLCGLGGVGKTTIATEVAKNQKIFEKVIMATVSQESNIEKIQGEIAEKLSMQLTENNTNVRAFRLCERLKQEKNMLLILDNLWEELDLGKVGIPLFSVEGCKILLTSRDKALLSHRMKCQKIVEVGVLSEDEALELFKKTAELSTDSSCPELISIATDIVQKCGGLPLAIVTAAKALRSKDICEWQDALARLNNPFRRNNTLTREMDTILKLSFDCLSSSEYKNIFLLAAMLSHDPSIEDLLMYSVGLDILGGIENMEGARVGVLAIVQKLKSSNLFLDSILSHYFTMHDVFRDVALSIAASKESNAVIERYKRLNEWPDDPECCKGICLQKCDICDLPEVLNGPILEFFLLNSKKSDLTIPNTFFKFSKKLKVLAISKVNFSSLPLLCFLKQLKALCLHSCLLEDITGIRRLRKLKVLSLACSEIQQLPVELAELTSLQMLDLSHCSQLKVIPQKLLSSLKKLEVLYMGNSFKQWKVEESGNADENASLDELMDLPISSLEIHILDLSMMPENLFLKMNLRRYRIFIGKRWTWYSNYGASKILKLELKSSIDLMTRLQHLSKGVEDLHLYGSNGQENVLYNLAASGFPCLRHLQIESNYDIKYIVLNSAHQEDAFPILEGLELKNLKAFENLCEGPNEIVFGQLHTLKMESGPAFAEHFNFEYRATKNASDKIFKSLFNKVFVPKLEILELSNLNSLIPLIWDNQLLHNSFNNLKTLTVEKCGFVKLVPLHVMKSLNNLEELHVEDCDMLEIVFDFEDLNDYYKEMESSLVVVPLKKLYLTNLPKLKNVWSNNCQGNISFPSLRSAYVFGCDSLTSIFPVFIGKAARLRNLEEVTVRFCDMLEIVFDFEDLNDYYKEMESSSVVVPLKKLDLADLPKLKNVWSDHYQGNASFPSLRSVKVYHCKSLTSIFPASIAKGMLCDLEALEIHGCGVDVIVAKDQVLESVAVTFEFPRLTSLLLSSLPNLKNFYPQKHTLEWPHLNKLSIQCCDELEIFEKEVLGSSKIYEEENMQDSKYPLLSHDKVIGNLEGLGLQGKEVEKIGSSRFLMYHFPKLKRLHLSLQKKPSFTFWEWSLNLGELKLSGDFEKALGGDNVAALAAHFPQLTLEKISIMGSLSPSLVSSPNLTHLNVKQCNEWATLMTSSIAQSLVHLTHLSISDCDQMEEIITKQEGEDDGDKEILFRKLEFLELGDLPRLKRFCGSNYTFKFLLLDQLIIKRCPKFKAFSPGLVETPSLKSVQLWEDGTKHHEIWDTNLNKTVYFQRCVTSREVVLDEDDAIMIRNDQYPADCYPKVEILQIEGFVEEWVTFRYTLFERFPKLNELHVKNSSFEKVLGGDNIAALTACFPELTLENISIMGSLSPSLVFSPNLTNLNVTKCHEWTTLMTSSIARSLVHLTHLSISLCYEMEEIITKDEGEDDGDKEIFFRKLEFLKLDRLPRLKRFCGYNFAFRFPLLKYVTIIECPQLTMFCPGAIHAPQLQSVGMNEFDSCKAIWMTDLNNTIQHLFTFKEVLPTTRSMVINAKNITRIVDVFPNVESLYVESFTDEGVTFPYSSFEKFPKLHWLEVEHCSFEEIFPSQDQIIDFMGKISPLMSLRIAYMDKLKSIWKDDSQLPPIHQNLSYLQVKSCCSLVKLAPSSASFQNLCSLFVSRCHQLIHLATTSTAKSLVSLVRLEINDCKRMEEIVMNDTNEDVQVGITFNQLEEIKLTDMPSLKMFSPQSHTFEFPELEKIKISGCPEMKKLCPGVLKTPKLSKVKIEEHDMKWKDEGDLNKTMEGLSLAKDSINI